KAPPLCEIHPCGGGVRPTPQSRQVFPIRPPTWPFAYLPSLSDAISTPNRDQLRSCESHPGVTFDTEANDTRHNTARQALGRHTTPLARAATSPPAGRPALPRMRILRIRQSSMFRMDLRPDHRLAPVQRGVPPRFTRTIGKMGPFCESSPTVMAATGPAPGGRR